jgi:hypothetical protein
MVTELWTIWAPGDETTASAYLAVFRGTSIILSRFAPFGEVASLLELLLGAATAVMGACGVLVCLDRHFCSVDVSPIGAEYRLPDDNPYARAINYREEDADVTVRLEGRYLGFLHRARCIVIIQESRNGVLEKGQEAWRFGGDHER